ncbi:PREDICTED: uncharacterized protein LOC106805838 [Priapulus caudatus]|uniref:Uncharacterized protein LOC106805838 n=1 Tax=Priapulus caudatus TaxID=37621 RepID=A0ABM1DT11_PRICU|nr:PREDICTED: uncharacterized protein LOC106805838 [Priapulus caudatus]
MVELLDESIIRPTRTDGTRWVDHKQRDLQALERNYVAVAAHFTKIGSEQRSDVRKEDAVKARGMVKKMCSYKFVLYMAMYIDILQEPSQVSLVFQKEDICLADVIEVVRTTEEILHDMCNKHGPKLQSVKRQCSEGSYRSLALTGFETGHAQFLASRPHHIQPLINCLEQRFSTFRDDELLSAVQSLNPKTWPEDLKDLGCKVDDDVRITSRLPLWQMAVILMQL